MCSLEYNPQYALFDVLLDYQLCPICFFVLRSPAITNFPLQATEKQCKISTINAVLASGDTYIPA